MSRQRFRLPLFTLTLAAVAFAQTPRPGAWTPPRGPDGHPLLEGIWNSASLTPLERPAALGSKEFYTEAEAAAYEKKRLDDANRDRRDGPAEADVGRSYNELFYDRGIKLARGRRTSLIVDPANGRIPPMTAEGQARLHARDAYFRVHPADGPEDRPLADRCLMFSQSGPPMIPGNYNNNYQIVQAGNALVILAEMGNQARVMSVDGRAPLPGAVAQWTGDSHGHWEGDTLVVETTNFRFNERSRFGVQYEGGLTDDKLRITERFTRGGENFIIYRAMISDPGVYTRAWTFEVALERAEGPLYEYACHEGNYGLAGVLSGARAQERLEAPGAVVPDSGFRLPLAKRDELDAQGRKFYDEVASEDPRNIAGLRGPNGIRLYSPKLGQLQRDLNLFLRSESGLSGRVRELAILAAARAADNQFEWAAHEPLARREGLGNEVIEAVRVHGSLAGLTEEQRAVIQLSREIFEGQRVTQETFSLALNAFGRQGLVNLVSLMGSYAATAALLKTFDMQLPPGVKPPLP